MVASAPVRISRITPEQWAAYKALRLRALLDSPEAFGSTYEREAASSDAGWRSRVAAASPDHDLPLFGHREDQPVGLCWAKRLLQDLQTAHVFQMWVDPQARGLGLGRMLLEHSVAWAGARGVLRVRLAVTINNSAARLLYRSFGFSDAGEPEPLRPGSELLSQPMELRLDVSSGFDPHEVG
ncbi:MAG: GNAT family N-acetyltransferase [Pseudomonadota bacterium]